MAPKRFLLAAAIALLTAVPAAAQPHWAPAASALIHPGVGIGPESGECTAAFVFYDATDVYLATAAHCVEDTTATLDQPPCGTYLPDGTPLKVEGAAHPARLVYSSWHAMDIAHEPYNSACTQNDFALARLDPADAWRVNPSLPYWGGPTGIRLSPLAATEALFSYGLSSFHGDREDLKRREGRLVDETADGWLHEVYFATPGLPGDSGSAVLDGAGAATGVLATLRDAPPAANGVVDLGLALAYMRAHSTITARLANGTEPFIGPQLGLPYAPSPPPAQDPQPEPAPAAPASPPAAPAPAPVAAPQPDRKAPTKAKHRVRVKRCHARRTRRAGCRRVSRARRRSAAKPAHR